MRAAPTQSSVRWPTANPERSAAWLLRMLPLACVVLALMTLTLPVVFTHMPPLLDYPNHRARMWLLAGGFDQAPMSAMYAADWSSAWTNIGIDVLAATVGHLIGGLTLAPLLLSAAIILPPLGAVLLNRAVFGGWHWWQSGFAVLAWNTTLLAGFLNFQIGLGLALVAAAADPAIQRRAGSWGAVPVRLALTSVLLVFHPFAAGFYGVLLAALTFGPEPLNGAKALAQRGWRAAIVGGVSVGIPAACFALMAPTLPGNYVPPGVFDTWEGYTILNKTMAVLTALVTYDLPVDLTIIALLCAAAGAASISRSFQLHTGLLAGALGLVVLAVAVPSNLAAAGSVDWRFPIMAALTGVAAIRPGLPSARAGQLMAVALMVLGMARTAWIAGIWHERQSDIAAVEELLAMVPEGAAVLPVEHTDIDRAASPPGRYLAGGLPFFWHLPTLAVPQRHAFVPTMFSAPGKQPLRVKAPWSDIAVGEGIPAPVRYLRAYVPSERADFVIGYMAHWRDRFSYVLVVNADAQDASDEASVPGLQLLADRGFARLYRVTPPPAGRNVTQ